MSVLLFLVILVVLILVHEWGHFFVAKKSGIRVDEFGIGFPPKLWGKRRGETEYTVNALPFGGFVRIWGENPDDIDPDNPDYKRSFIAKPKWKQALVLFAGVGMNIIFAWALFVIGFSIGMPSANPDIAPEHIKDRFALVTEVLDGSPAAQAGLQIGDRVASLKSGDDQITEVTSKSVAEFVQSHTNQEIHISYERDAMLQTAVVVPEAGVVSEDAERAAIGVAVGQVAIVQMSPPQAVWAATKMTVTMLYAVTDAMLGLVVGAFTLTADISQITGPVGIVSLVGDASAFGFIYVLSFTALISLNLAIVNLLPLPALDGGRLLFLAIEAVKGSPIKARVTNLANTIGFALLILLMLVITYNDIVRLVTE